VASELGQVEDLDAGDGGPRRARWRRPARLGQLEDLDAGHADAGEQLDQLEDLDAGELAQDLCEDLDADDGEQLDQAEGSAGCWRSGRL
jgi:hypothetical protein